MNFFDYFQIASAVTFFLIIAARTIYMRTARHINPIVIGRGKRGLVRAAELIWFVGLFVWIVEMFLYATHSSFHIFPAPLHMPLVTSELVKLIGISLVAVGLIVFLLAFVSFGDSWRVGFDTKTPGELVTTGIFAFSRNPIYVFLDLWFLGIFLINGTLLFLVFAILAFAVVHWQIRQEEVYLSKLYGQPYHEYLSRTKRYVGL